MKHINLKSTVLFCNALLLPVLTARAQDVNIGSGIQYIPTNAKFLNDIADARFSPSVKLHQNLKGHPYYAGWPLQYGMQPRVEKFQAKISVYFKTER